MKLPEASPGKTPPVAVLPAEHKKSKKPHAVFTRAGFGPEAPGAFHWEKKVVLFHVDPVLRWSGMRWMRRIPLHELQM